MNIYSPKNTLVSHDWMKWLYNSFIFLIPVIIVLLLESVKIIPEDWQYGALTLYVINVVVDILKKYKEENTYKE